MLIRKQRVVDGQKKELTILIRVYEYSYYRHSRIRIHSFTQFFFKFSFTADLVTWCKV